MLKHKPLPLQFRQGDVLLEKIAVLPADAQPMTDLIVARGEHSGHAHAVLGEAKLFESRECIYLVVQGEATLSHVMEESLATPLTQWTGEHGEISLPEGVYQLTLQREYDPYAKINRQVKD